MHTRRLISCEWPVDTMDKASTAQVNSPWAPETGRDKERIEERSSKFNQSEYLIRIKLCLSWTIRQITSKEVFRSLFSFLLVVVQVKASDVLVGYLLFYS